MAGQTGIVNTYTHTAVAVAVTSTTLLAANGNAAYRIFINDSDTAVYINLGTTAVANAGIRLNSGGGSYEMSAHAGNLFTGAVYAIQADSGTKLVLVSEANA
tara:strand:+ start:188 stop:493 length:306 start_codon:yes stop_codon:yes gene_type:complete